MNRAELTTILNHTGRIARRVILVLLGVLAVVLLAVILALSRPQTRRALLEQGIARAGSLLDGELTVGEADWPGLGRIVLLNVDWQVEGRALAHVDSLVVDLDVGALGARDITVREVLLAGVTADVAGIQASLPATETPPDTMAQATPGELQPPPAPLRPGALSPLPSLAVERFAVHRVAATITAEQTVWLDRLLARVDLRAGRPGELELAIRARPLPDFAVAWYLDGQLDQESLRLATAPLTVDHVDSIPPIDKLATSGLIEVPRAQVDALLAGQVDWPTLAVRDLDIDGDLGQWRLGASLRGREPGELTIASSLPRAPRAMLGGLAAAGLDTLATGWIDTLGNRWHHQEAPGLSLQVGLVPPAADAEIWRGKIDATGRVVLPAVRTLAPLLPPELRVDAWGPLIVNLDAAVDARQGMPRGRLRADLAESDWLDVALIDLHADTTEAVLDTLTILLPGLEMHAGGRVDRQSVDLALQLDLPDARLARLWDDPVLTDLEASLHADVTARGAWPLPQTRLDAIASAVTPQATVPRAIVRARASTDSLAFSVELPEGLTTPTQAVQKLSLGFAGVPADSLRRLDGRLTLAGRADPLGLDLDTGVALADLTTAPSGTLTVDTLAVRFEDHELRNVAPWTLAFATADTSASISGLQMSGGLGLLNLDALADVDSLAADLGLDLRLDLTPLAALIDDPAVASFLPEATLTVGGRMQAAGAPGSPWATGDLRVGFADHEELSRLAAESRVTLTGAGTPPRELEILAREGGRPRVDFDLNLLAADTNLVRVRVDAPLPDGSDRADSLRVSLTADRADLANLQPLLPSGIELSGRFDADTRISGELAYTEDVPDLALGGGLRLEDLRLSLPDGSWLAMDGNVELDGTSLAPQVRGGLDIDGGLLRIPDPPPTLLPADGEAMLWELTPPDTVATAAASVDSSDVAVLTQAILPELEFKVTCPGRLWLRGQGLDIELAGDLTLRLKEGLPAIEGELEAVQGTMTQLGHVFRLQRGRIVFYADENALDPELDLALGVRVKDYSVRILVGGSANEPTLAFESDPELTDGDIVSLLLFGYTADELDEGQSSLLAERAGQIAAAYGANALAESVAKEIGVDVLSIAPREGDEDTTALTVGKYLSPRVLVRYEQLLDEESAFFVHLDYHFWRELKLHTQVSQGEQSGAELKWSTDW